MNNFRIAGLIILLCGISLLVNPAAATNKVIDHGTVYSSSDLTNHFKFEWKTYEYKNGAIKVLAKVYIEKKGKWAFLGNESISLQKISKTKIKLSIINLSGFKGSPEYIKTTHSLKNYYWHNFRPDRLLKGHYMPVG
jgi:hypothetical protein